MSLLGHFDARFTEQRKLFAGWFGKLHKDMGKLREDTAPRRETFALAEQFRRMEQRRADQDAAIAALQPDEPSLPAE